MSKPHAHSPTMKLTPAKFQNKNSIISIHHECEGGIENLSRGSPIGITRLAE